ncbi:MAG: hypothetical protein AAB074_14035 [Planctomycetota bacterium]
MRALLFLMLIPCAATAQDRVGDGIYLEFDVQAFKAGQWVEQELTTKFIDEDGKAVAEHWFSRLACIRTDDEFVWMEETRWSAARPDERTVTQHQLRRKDGEVLKAWRGKPGSKGEILEICKSLPVTEIHPRDSKRTGNVTTEKLEVGGTVIEIQKIQIEIVEPGEKGKKFIKTICISKSAPFPIRWDDEGVLRRKTEEATLAGTIEVTAGVVSIERTWPNGSSRFAVIAMGIDAKPTLTTK